MCCSHALRPNATALLANFSLDAALVSVEILWVDPSARPPAGALAAGAAWAMAGLEFLGADSTSGCRLLDGPAPASAAGSVGRQLVCGAAGRQVVLSLPAVARAAAGGVLVRMCLSRLAGVSGIVTMSVQAAP